MSEHSTNQHLETQYWLQYEQDLYPLAQGIVEHAGYLEYHLNPIGRFKNEFSMFAENALNEISELELRLAQMKIHLLQYQPNP